MKIVSLMAFAAIVLVACTPKTAEVVVKEETVEFPSTDIAEGSKLYVENCGKCHKLKTVTDFSSEQWKKIVPNMAAKAKLDATAENQIMLYVLWKTENK